jgi:ribosomal protein S16
MLFNSRTYRNIKKIQLLASSKPELNQRTNQIVSNKHSFIYFLKRGITLFEQWDKYIKDNSLDPIQDLAR